MNGPLTYTEEDVEGVCDLSGGIQLCKDNEIEYEDLENVEQIRIRLRARLLGNVPVPDRPTEMQKKFREFTARDAELRQLHCSVYEELKKFFHHKQCSEDVLSLVNRAIRDCRIRVEQNHSQLRDNGCPILVAGESGAGKSSFLNLLIGADINPIDDTLHATSTICELHNDTIGQALITYGPDHPKYTEGQTQEVMMLDVRNPQAAQRDLRQYTIGSDRSTRNRRIYDLIKVLWPIPMLQVHEGRVFLVDSPGVGEDEAEVTNKVLSYLPKAAAFIYIINCAVNGGGLSENRLECLLKPVTLQTNEDELQVFNPKSAIFILNKWDEVEGDKTRREVKEQNIKKLKRLWPGLDAEKQIYCLSVSKAQKKLKLGGGETEDYKDLLDCLYHFMETSLSLTINNHHRWLNHVHGRILNIVQTNFTSAKRTKLEKQQVASVTKGKLQQLQEHADEVIRDLEEKLGLKMSEIADALVSHLRDDKTVEDLAEECLQQDSDNEIAEEMVDNKNRTRMLIIDAVTKEVRAWESGEGLIEKARAELIAEFNTKFDKVGDMLQEIEAGMQGTSAGVSNAAPLFIKQDGGVDSLSFSSMDKLIIGLTAPIWLPLAIVTFAVALPVLIPLTIHDNWTHRQELQRYRRDKRPSIVTWTREVVDNLSSDTVKQRIVQKQMAQIGVQLEYFKTQIPQIIEADNELMQKVTEEVREQAEIEGQYSPLLKQIKKSFGKLQHVKLRYLQKDEPDYYRDSDITIKEELGHGAFGKVHVVSLVVKGETEVSQVAGKTMKQRLTDDTAVAFAQERDILRSFEHENIVQYIGTSINSEDEFVLLMELCKCTLYDEIFRNKVPVPGKVREKEKFVRTFKEMVDRARQIANGLSYIHQHNYVHRDVKMSNILVNDTDVLKLSDLGQAKPESSVTDTYRGTRFYRDPKVLRGGLATQEADVYSFGIIMYELWFGFIVYSDVFADELINIDQVEEEIRRGERKPHFDVKGFRHPIPELCHLLDYCWRDKPVGTPLERISSRDIYAELGKMLRAEFIDKNVVPWSNMEFDCCQQFDEGVQNDKEASSSYF